MKKSLSILLVLTALLSFAYRPVLAAEGTLVLLETRNDVSGNVIFVFHFSGDFNKNDFKGGLVFFGDMKFPMGCNIVDEDEGIVQCTTSRATAGQNVVVNLAGFVFYTFVPFRSGGGGSSGTGVTQFCYNVYDMVEVQGGNQWEAFTTHCQDVPANYNDTIDEYYPYALSTYTYVFLANDPGGCSMVNSVSEDAYYHEFNGC